MIGLCHLSTDDARNYTDPSPETLVNGGDLTELCGLRVVGRTGRKWWATAPSDEPNCLGFAARRRPGAYPSPRQARRRDGERMRRVSSSTREKRFPSFGVER